MQRVLMRIDAARPHGDLRNRFFTRRIQHLEAILRDTGQRLRQQRRFANARIAAEQDERASNQSATEHAIEFADGRRDAAVAHFGDHIGYRDRTRAIG